MGIILSYFKLYYILYHTRLERRNHEMGILLEARSQELEEAEIAREEGLSKFGEAWKEVWRKEEEMRTREEEWEAKMKKKEEELQDKEDQILSLSLQLDQEKKEKTKESSGQDDFKHLLVCKDEILEHLDRE